MHEDALKLHELWRKDLARDKLLEESRGLKAKIADRSEAAEASAKKLSACTDNLARLKGKEREANRKAETYTKRRDAAQRSIDQGLATDYEAAEGQVRQCSEILDEVETQQLELMESIEEASELLKRTEMTLALNRSQAEAAQKAYDDRYPTLKAEFDQATAVRNAAREDIWKDLLQRYDELRKKRRPAFADIRDKSCTGCNVQINATDLSTHRRAAELVTCRQCGRLLGEFL